MGEWGGFQSTQVPKGGYMAERCYNQGNAVVQCMKSTFIIHREYPGSFAGIIEVQLEYAIEDKKNEKKQTKPFKSKQTQGNASFAPCTGLGERISLRKKNHSNHKR